MRLKYPCKSFFCSYFTVNNLIYGLVSAIFLSIFLYLEYFQITNYLLNSLFALIGLYMLIHASKFQLSIAGFFIGLFWFWWIALSFRYYDLSIMIPFVIVGVGFIYGLLFLLIGLLHPFLRIFVFTFLGFISLFGFDWLRSEAIFVHTYFGVQWWQILIVMVALYGFAYKKYSLLLLFVALEFSSVDEIQSKQHYLVQTNISQETKWQPQMLNTYIQTVFEEIDKAKQNGYSSIIFPEAFLTTYLNQNIILYDQLRHLSSDITIIIGALHHDGMPKNSTYIFEHNHVTVADKVVLVPFGEANPLPKFLGDWVNKVFFKGAQDYEKADEFTTIEIQNKPYTTAICYEATDRSLYSDNPQNIIAMSNNAWFMPSIQPTLQKILLQAFVKKSAVTIYHATNASKSYILQRKEFGLFRN